MIFPSTFLKAPSYPIKHADKNAKRARTFTAILLRLHRQLSRRARLVIQFLISKKTGDFPKTSSCKHLDLLLSIDREEITPPSPAVKITET